MLDEKRITGHAPGLYLANAHVQWDRIAVEDLPEMDFEPMERERYRLREGDLLVCEGGEVGRTAMWRGELAECFYQKAIHRVRPRSDREIPRFFYYVMYSLANRGVFVAGGNPNTIDHLTAVDLRHYRFAFPPLGEQRAIVAFLDGETAKIDALVSKKERLIELLMEKRGALISRAVTRGLDPNAPMKDSSVEWLGEIPAHWKIEKNRWLFRETHGRSQHGDEELLTVSHITGVTKRSEKNVTMIEPESHEGYRVCTTGELVINTMWAWMGALGIAREDGMVSPSYNVYQISDRELNPVYYDYLSRSSAHVMELARMSKGVWKSRLRLYPADFFDICTPVPPEREQSLIVAHLEHVVRQIDGLLLAIERAIGQLLDLRSALVSAAVTGRIDVREGWAA